MDEPLTLEESFAKATEQREGTLKEETSNEEQSLVQEPTEAESATPEELKTKDESELERIDPEKLPPELKSVYKDLMRGFTQGRQKDSEARKAAEDKARDLEERLARIEQGNPNTSQSPETPQFRNAEEYYAFKAEEKVREALQSEKINSYRETALNDYEAADERLRRPSEDKENPAYDEFMDVSISGKLDELLSEHVAKNGSELGFDHKGETQRLIKVWEDSLQGRIKSYVEKQNQLIKSKAGESRVHNPKTSSGKAESSKSMSLSEAMEAAQEKLINK